MTNAAAKKLGLSHTALLSIREAEGNANIQFGRDGAAPFSKFDGMKQRKPPPSITTENWMLEYAKAALTASKGIRRWRHNHLVDVEGYPSSIQVRAAEGDDEEDIPEPPADPAKGIMETHTGIPHVFASTQASSAEWEHVGDEPALEGKENGDGGRAVRAGLYTVEYAKPVTIATDEHAFHEENRKAQVLAAGGWEFDLTLQYEETEQDQVVE